tara:strand:+ start:894 stop:1145 length:252 start_codon:yes stop_codon:yes gene_type:complete
MIVSPCISICRFEPVTDYCYGCGRTTEEKFKWKDPDTTDEWKLNNLSECTNRLSGWQKKSFLESYEHKKQHGISLFKAKNLKK